MNEEFEKWWSTTDEDLMPDHSIREIKTAFLAGAAAMREKAAEVARKYPTNTKMMVIGSGLIAGAIERLEV